MKIFVLDGCFDFLWRQTRVFVSFLNKVGESLPVKGFFNYGF